MSIQDFGRALTSHQDIQAKAKTKSLYPYSPAKFSILEMLLISVWSFTHFSKMLKESSKLEIDFPYILQQIYCLCT